ncbi:hypothetical protein [Planktotalea sp.]|uniref:hypothetical protein n=1 Tax=Planktotalea sp. TaxID=2029877 RepID=UPI003D6A7DE3
MVLAPLNFETFTLVEPLPHGLNTSLPHRARLDRLFAVVCNAARSTPFRFLKGASEEAASRALAVKEHVSLGSHEADSFEKAPLRWRRF